MLLLDIAFAVLGRLQTQLQVLSLSFTIKTLTAPEQMKMLFLEGGVVPTRMSLFKDPDFVKQYPHAQVMLDIIDSAVARPRHPRYREISEVIQTESLSAINQQKTAKAAVADIAKTIQPMVA